MDRARVVSAKQRKQTTQNGIQLLSVKIVFNVHRVEQHNRNWRKILIPIATNGKDSHGHLS